MVLTKSYTDTSGKEVEYSIYEKRSFLDDKIQNRSKIDIKLRLINNLGEVKLAYQADTGGQ